MDPPLRRPRLPLAFDRIVERRRGAVLPGAKLGQMGPAR